MSMDTIAQCDIGIEWTLEPALNFMKPDYQSNTIVYATTTPNNVGSTTISVQVYYGSTVYEFDFVVTVIDQSCADVQYVATSQQY